MLNQTDYLSLLVCHYCRYNAHKEEAGAKLIQKQAPATPHKTPIFAGMLAQAANGCHATNVGHPVRREKTAACQGREAT